MTSEPTPEPLTGLVKGSKKLGMMGMTLLVINAMTGEDAFNLPQNMAESASLVAVTTAWFISGMRTFFLARTFQVLSDIRPGLTAG